MPLNLHPKFFPVADAAAARLVVTIRDAGLDAMRFAHACMRAVWVEERDISDRATLEAILREQGFTPGPLLAAAETPAAAAAYQAENDLAVAMQIFGAPSYVLEGEIFWGQDRLDFLARALERGPAG